MHSLLWCSVTLPTLPERQMEDAHSIATEKGRLAQLIRRFSDVYGAWYSELSLEVRSTHKSKQSNFPLLFGETAWWCQVCRVKQSVCQQLRFSPLFGLVLQPVNGHMWAQQSQKTYTGALRFIHSLLISTSSAVITLFTFLQHKSLWQLLFNSHWDRYLNDFLHRGEFCREIKVGDSLCSWAVGRVHSYSWK